jgi:hypothetical protein
MKNPRRQPFWRPIFEMPLQPWSPPSSIATRSISRKIAFSLMIHWIVIVYRYLFWIKGMIPSRRKISQCLCPARTVIINRDHSTRYLSYFSRMFSLERRMYFSVVDNETRLSRIFTVNKSALLLIRSLLLNAVEDAFHQGYLFLPSLYIATKILYRSLRSHQL